MSERLQSIDTGSVWIDVIELVLNPIDWRLLWKFCMWNGQWNDGVV